MNVPNEDAFVRAGSIETLGGTVDYLHDDNLDELAARMLEDCEEFEHITALDPRICFVWKRKGGRSGGQANFSNPVKCNGLIRYLGNYEYIVWVAADHAREFGFDDKKIEAALFRALMRLQLNRSEDADSLCIVAHQFSGSIPELKRYGAWFEELKVMQKGAQQLPLFRFKETTKRRPAATTKAKKTSAKAKPADKPAAEPTEEETSQETASNVQPLFNRPPTEQQAAS